jgi:1-acyl-sn-glycerol-3-phosphate acyltransferase
MGDGRASERRVHAGGAPQRGAVLLGIYNALYWPYLLVSCIALFAPAIAIFAATVWWDRKRRLLHAYTSWWGAHYLSWAPLAGVKVEGRDQGLAAAPCVYVSNHQSMVDILAVFATGLRYRWVSKRENFIVPFLGWNMYLNGYVPLRRGHLPSIRRMLRNCQARISEGHSLFVFPEGTRSPDGTVQQFFRGAFWIATKNRIPVVPVLIEGTDRVLAKSSFRIVPQLVTVRVLEPIHPSAAGYDDRRLRDMVRERMLEEQASIRGQRRPKPVVASSRAA